MLGQQGQSKEHRAIQVICTWLANSSADSADGGARCQWATGAAGRGRSSDTQFPCTHPKSLSLGWVSLHVLNSGCRALRGQFRASINWVRNFCSWTQILPVRSYFYGGVNEERRKTVKKKTGMEELYGILGYKTGALGKYLWRGGLWVSDLSVKRQYKQRKAAK